MNVLHEHNYYLMQETKKPTYLDFYELEEKDLPKIDCYLEQTVRYNDKWFFIKSAKTYFSLRQENYPKLWIKYLYKTKEAIK